MKTITSKEKKLRVFPRGLGQDKGSYAQVSQVIVSTCQLHISKNPTMGPSDSTAQADQQRAGKIEFFIFKSTLPIIKIREHQLETL